MVDALTSADRRAESTPVTAARKQGGGTGPRVELVAFYVLSATAVLGLMWLAPAVPLLIAGSGLTVALSWLVLRPDRVHFAIMLLSVAIATVFTLQLSGLPLHGQVWGLSAAAVCFIVFLALPIRSQPGFPLLHVYCLVQGVYLLVAVAFAQPPPAYRITFHDDVRTKGFALSALFMAVLVTTAVLTSKRLSSRERVGRDAGSPRRDRAVAALVLGAVVSIAIGRLSLTSGLGALAEVIRLVPLLGALALADLWLRRSLGVPHKLLLIAAGILYVLAGLGTGLLYAAVGPFLAGLALYLARRRTVPWGLVGVATLAFVVLNAGKEELRSQPNQPRQGGLSRAPTFLAATHRALAEVDADSLATAAYRFSISDGLGYIHEVVPDKYPYWDKRSYVALPFTLVPRVLAPFKPRLTFANEFGRSYGLLHVDDYITSANTPLAVEAYVNFGLVGMVLVGTLAGAFLSLVGRLLKGFRCSDVLLGSALTAQALGAIESGATGFVLVIPFLFILRPVSRWLAPAACGASKDAAVPAPAPSPEPADASEDTPLWVCPACASAPSHGSAHPSGPTSDGAGSWSDWSKARSRRSHHATDAGLKQVRAHRSGGFHAPSGEEVS